MIELLKELQNTNINRYISISKRGGTKSISSFLLAIPISDNPIRKFVKSHSIIENIL